MTFLLIPNQWFPKKSQTMVFLKIYDFQEQAPSLHATPCLLDPTIYVIINYRKGSSASWLWNLALRHQDGWEENNHKKYWHHKKSKKPTVK